MRRDTYRDYVTDQGLANAGGSRVLANAFIHCLVERSGGGNVRGGRLHVLYDPCVMATKYAVSFDSRSWTG